MFEKTVVLHGKGSLSRCGRTFFVPSNVQERKQPVKAEKKDKRPTIRKESICRESVGSPFDESDAVGSVGGEIRGGVREIREDRWVAKRGGGFGFGVERGRC